MTTLFKHADRDDQSVLLYLKNFDVFEDFSKSELETVEEKLKITSHRKGEAVLLPSENHRRIYFLLSGKVKLLRTYAQGKEFILVILNEGELFGLLAPLVEGYRNPMVIAIENCLVGSMIEKDFLTLMRQKSTFSHNINQYLGERVVRTEDRVDDLVFLGIPNRLARILLRFAKQFPGKRNCGTLIDLKLTQEEIANSIGAARESTSSVLNRFKRKGWIEMHNRHICIHNSSALWALAYQH